MFVCLACVFITFNSFIVLPLPLLMLLLLPIRISFSLLRIQLTPCNELLLILCGFAEPKERKEWGSQIKGEWQQLLGLAAA